jgi:hypothetical protein
MVDMADLKKRPNDSGEDALLVPTGTPLYESLSAKLIAFDRLLSTLGQGGYSGFVRVLGSGVNSILLFRNGNMIDCLWRDRDGLNLGDPALAKAQALIQAGDAVVDVVDLEPEMVDSLHHLASGTQTYPEMFASWVNMEGLVEFLKQRNFTGTISVRSNSGGGVLMLRHGELAGAFTTSSRELATDQGEVVALCDDPEARIEVRSGAGQQGGARHDEEAAESARSVAEVGS